MVDCPFHSIPGFIEGVLVIGMPPDSGKHMEPHMAVGIGDSTIFHHNTRDTSYSGRRYVG